MRAGSQAEALDLVESCASRGSPPSCRRARRFRGRVPGAGRNRCGQLRWQMGRRRRACPVGQEVGPRGAQPFQLLADYADQNDARAGALFAEFAGVFKGRRQLVWSPGLKKLAGIDEVSDEQAAEDAVRMADESKHDERVGHFTPKGWSVVRRHRAALLKFAELAGAAGVDAVVQASKPPSPPLPTGKPGAGACVAVQAAQGPQARGSGGSMHPSGGAP